MTPLTPPTETLVRIPFSGLTDFQPLALAPGLPMLDVNKLTYQVLLGWFGDLLGEPELDDDGVAFHAQHNGHRQIITSRASDDIVATTSIEFVVAFSAMNGVTVASAISEVVSRPTVDYV